MYCSKVHNGIADRNHAFVSNVSSYHSAVYSPQVLASARRCYRRPKVARDANRVVGRRVDVNIAGVGHARYPGLRTYGVCAVGVEPICCVSKRVGCVGLLEYVIGRIVGHPEVYVGVDDIGAVFCVKDIDSQSSHLVVAGRPVGSIAASLDYCSTYS